LRSETTDLNLVLPLGEVAALGGALLWTIATAIYGRVGQTLPPLLLNSLKGAIAIAALLATYLLSDRPWPALTSSTTVLLVASGILGIGLGDTAYLASLKALGARRALLLETLAPPLSALLAWLFLRETLSPLAGCGIAVTLLGVGWTIAERTPERAIAAAPFWQGLGWALVAEAAQAGGAVLSRAALLQPDISALDGSLLRLSGGTGVAFLLLFLRPGARPTQDWRLLRRALGAVAIASLLGTYLGIWLQQTAFKFAPTGIAQTLLATSPIFVLPLAAAAGERLSWRAIAGAAIAVSGIALLFQ